MFVITNRWRHLGEYVGINGKPKYYCFGIDLDDPDTPLSYDIVEEINSANWMLQYCGMNFKILKYGTTQEWSREKDSPETYFYILVDADDKT